MPHLDIGPVDTLPIGERICVEFNERRIVVFNTDDGMFAIDAVCAHAGGPLEEGVVKSGVVTCPWHLHRYDIDSGDRVDMAGVTQQTFDVHVEDGRLSVDVPDPEPKLSMRDMLLKHAEEWDRGE